MKYKVKAKFDYPEDQHQHMIDPKQTHKNDLDNKFKYYDTTFWYRFRRVLLHIFLMTIGRIIIFFRYKPKYYGKENLKKYKDVLDKGFVSACNHVFEWDFICLRLAIPTRKGYVMLWHNNHNRAIGRLIRDFGSVPLPKDDFGASLKMFKDIKKLLNDGGWLHVYPEEAMWYFYQDLREFRDGAFYIACTNDKPILPLSYSFRPAKGLCKLWKKDYPNITITIGEPLFPNKDLEMKERIKDLSDRAHAQIRKQIWDHTPEEE